MAGLLYNKRVKYLIYGDDQTRIAKKAAESLETWKKKGIISSPLFDGEKNSYEEWLELNNQSLFATKKVIRLTHIYSGRRSQLKEKVKSFLKKTKGENIYLVVENKLLSRPASYFDQVYKYKKEVYLFKLLDSLSEKKFSLIPRVIQQIEEPYELLLFMILRRLEDLLSWQYEKKVPQGYYQSKLKAAAGYWQERELFSLLSSLLKFDLDYKSGKTYHQDPKLALSLFLFSYREVKNAS